MKKNIFILFSFLLLFFMTSCGALITDEFDDSFVINEEHELIKYEGNANIISIPEGVEVIKAGAFDHSVLFSLILPSSLQNIEEGAFVDCYYLAEIFNYSNLRIETGKETNGSVGLYAKVINDHETKSKIRTYSNNYVIYDEDEESTLIYYTGQKKDLIMPMQFEIIGDYAFYQNEYLQSVVISQSVYKIGDYAFAECKNLSKIFLPESLEEIGDYSFYNDSRLPSIKLRSNVKSIGNNAFLGCYRLVEVFNISSNIEVEIENTNNGSIGLYAKVVHTNLTDDYSIIIENNFVFFTLDEVIYLIDYRGNNSIIILPDNVSVIYKYAFYDIDVYSLTIPANVTEIEDDTFTNFKYLVEVNNASELDFDSYFPYAIEINKLSSSTSKVNVNVDNVTYSLDNENKVLVKLITNSSCPVIENFESILVNAFSESAADSIILRKTVANFNVDALINSAIKNIYFEGSEEELLELNYGLDLLNSNLVTLHYYSEEEIEGYWHYDANKVVIWGAEWSE